MPLPGLPRPAVNTLPVLPACRAARLCRNGLPLQAAASAFRRRVVLDFCAAHHRIEPAHVPQLLALLSDQQGVQQQAALMEAEAWPGGPQAAAAPVAPAAACPAEAQAGPANGPAIGFLQHAAHLPGLGDVGLAADAAPSGAAQDVAPAQRSAVLAEHAGVPVDPGSDVALQQLLPSFITGQQHHLDSHRHDSVAAGGPAGVAAPNRSTEVPRQHLGQPAPQCETDSAVRQHAFIGTAEDRQKVNSRSRHGGGGPGAGEAQALQPGGHASGSAANGHSQQPSSAQPSSSQGQGRASNGQVESGRFSGERQAERRATDRQPEAEQRPGGRDSWRPDRGSSHGRAADAGGERQSSRRIAEERRAGVEWQGSRRIADERRAGDERQGSRRIAHERGAGDERQSSRMAVERGAGDERQGSRRGEDVKLRAELQAVRWHDDSARQEADGWQGRKGSGQQYADVAPSARAGHRELASTAAPARASAPLAPAAPPRTSAPGTAGQAAKGPVADGGSRKRGLSPAPAAGPGEQAAGEGSAKRRRELLVWKAQEPNPTDRPLMLPGTKIPAAAAPAASKAAAAGKGSTALSHAAAGTSSKPVAGGGARATAVNGRPLQQDAANRHRDDHHPQQQQQQFDKQRHQMQQHPPRNQQAAPAAPTLLITISNNPAPAPPLAPPLPGHANRPARFLAGPAPTMQQQPAFGVALPPGFGAASDGPIQAAGSVRQPAPLQFVSGPSLPLHLASASYDRADATAAVAGADGANGAAGYREPIPFDSSAQWQQQEQQWEEEWQPQQQQGWQQEQQQQQHYLDVVETDYDGASQRRIEYEGEWEEGPPGGLSPQQRRVEFEGQAHLQDRQHQHPADRGSFSKVDIPGAKDTQEALRLLQSAVERAVPEGEQACRLKRTVLRRMLEQLEVGYTQRTWVIFGIPFPHVGEIVVKVSGAGGWRVSVWGAGIGCHAQRFSFFENPAGFAGGGCPAGSPLVRRIPGSLPLGPPCTLPPDLAAGLLLVRLCLAQLRQQDGQHTQQYEALGQSGNGKPLSKLFSDLAALGLVQVLKPKYGRLDALVLLPALAEYMPPVSGGERPPSSIGGSAGRDRERSPPPKRSRREQLQQPGELRLAPEVARGSAEYEEFWDPAFRLDCRIFKQLRHGAVALDEVHRRVTIPRRLDGLQNFGGCWVQAWLVVPLGVGCCDPLCLMRPVSSGWCCGQWVGAGGGGLGADGQPSLVPRVCWQPAPGWHWAMPKGGGMDRPGIDPANWACRCRCCPSNPPPLLPPAFHLQTSSSTSSSGGRSCSRRPPARPSGWHLAQRRCSTGSATCCSCWPAIRHGWRRARWRGRSNAVSRLCMPNISRR